MAPEEPESTSRRQLIRGGIVLAGGALIGATVAEPASANDGQALVLGVHNQAQTPTSLDIIVGPALDLHAQNGPGLLVNSLSGAGLAGVSGPMDPNDPFVPSGVFGLADNRPGVVGQSMHGSGVVGLAGDGLLINPNIPAGVSGLADDGIGIFGRSQDGTAVIGQSDHGAGLVGLSDIASAVVGHSHLGTGVVGVSGGNQIPPMDPNDPYIPAGVFGLADEGTGILGRSIGGTGIVGQSQLAAAPAVEARNLQLDGIGLNVIGRLVLSTVGEAVIPKGDEFCTVNRPVVRPTSQILVTLKEDPGKHICVQYVVPANGSFRVVLTEKAKKAVRFSFVITG